MKGIRNRLAALALAIAGVVPAGITTLTVLGGAAPAAAQGLFYKEVEKDGRIYVFNTSKKYREWLVSHDMGIAITMIGQGPNGETVVAENETAMDLYNFKHDKPGYERPAPKPAAVAPTLPTSIKIGDGELKFGLLLQAWYVADTSPVPNPPSGTSWLGNNTGENTFRLRRSEIKLNGKITPAWGFEVMFDPAKAISPQTAGTDGKILQDLAVIFTGFHGQELALGQKKIVLTEEGVRSSSELDFMERAQVTRGLSDRRETGFFYKGEVGEHLGLWASVTNGTASNVNSDTNDTLFYAARIDGKPMPGLLVGVSGGTGGSNNQLSHLLRDRYGAHLKYDGTDIPIGARFEWMKAEDRQTTGSLLPRMGWYGTLLYTFERQYQLGVRYDYFDTNQDVPGNKIRTWTAGFHWLIKGKNINIKADYFNINQQSRKINGNLEETYSQFGLAAQVAF